MLSQTSQPGGHQTSEPRATYMQGAAIPSGAPHTSRNDFRPRFPPSLSEAYNDRDDSPSDTRSVQVPTAARNAKDDVTELMKGGKTKSSEASLRPSAPNTNHDRDVSDVADGVDELAFGTKTDTVSEKIIQRAQGISSNGGDTDDDKEWLETLNLEDSDLTDSIFAEDESRARSPRMPLPPDLDLDEDLLDPRAREAKIQRTQALAVANSSFQLLAERQKSEDDRALPSLDQNMPRVTFPEYGVSGYQPQDSDVWNPPEHTRYGSSTHMGARKAKIQRTRASALTNPLFQILAGRQKNEDDWALPSLDQNMPRVTFPDYSFSGYQPQDSEMWNPLIPRQIRYGGSAHMATLWRIHNRYDTFSKETRGLNVLLGKIDVRTLLRLHRDLIESLNLLKRVCCNARELCQSGISQEYVSIVVLTDLRPGVASLQRVNVDQIYKFTRLVDSLLHALYWTLRRGTIFPKLDQDVRGEVQAFMSNLGKIGDIFEAKVLGQRSRFGLQAIVDICRVVGHVLDVALLTYYSGHLQALDESLLDLDIEHFDIHYPSLSTRRPARPPAVVMRPRSLSCLDGFLRGRKVWVFHYGTLDHDSSALSDMKLYLSTSIEAFADTWGPVWKISPRNLIGNAVLRYSVVVGAIIPWTRVSETEPKPLLEEAFYHWTSSDEDESESETAPAIDVQKYPLLLIGGATELTISANMECDTDPVSLLRTLKHQDCLQRSGTVKPYRYKDSETVQVQAGHGGVQVGYSVQMKRNEGFTWKECVYKSWKNRPGERNPGVLEKWSGLEVSLCTFNTRRRRLSQIIGSEVMRNHLSNVLFRWKDPDCEEAYYSALNSEDSHAFYNLYVVSSRDWRLEIGTAVSLCLEVLLQTGLDPQDDLKAFHAPTSLDNQEWLAVVQHKKHSWAGLLKDSHQYATMAIATETCLEVSTPDWPEFSGQKCRTRPRRGVKQQGNEYSVLETKLICHRTNEGRTSGDAHLPRSRLSFGSSGSLEVLYELKRGALLVRWRPSIPFLGKAMERVSTCGQHSEYMKDEHLQEESLGLYVISRRASKLLPAKFSRLRSNDTLGRDHGARQTRVTYQNPIPNVGEISVKALSLQEPTKIRNIWATVIEAVRTVTMAMEE